MGLFQELLIRKNYIVHGVKEDLHQLILKNKHRIKIYERIELFNMYDLQIIFPKIQLNKLN